jgi:hypothetical protein
LVNHFEKFGVLHSVLLCYDVRVFADIQIDLDKAVKQVRNFLFLLLYFIVALYLV